jgi:DNA-directed RNA polymerase specialized sigma24 family protein
VLADELTLLPPRQQAAIRLTMQRRYSVRQITERMGWTPQQVARLLRAGLTTLAVCGHR